MNDRLARLHLAFREFRLCGARLYVEHGTARDPSQGRPDVLASTSFLPTAKCQPFDLATVLIASEALKTYLPYGSARGIVNSWYRLKRPISVLFIDVLYETLNTTLP